MADLAQLETALRNADAAGDAEAAQMLAGEIRRRRAAPVPATASDPSEGELPFRPFGIDTGLSMPQGLSRGLAGAGKSFVDTARGAGQLFGLTSANDIEESRRLDAPLMQSGAGITGNVLGSVAQALPAAMVPGANTIAGAGLIGAAQGALQPVGAQDSRLQNIGTGAAFGAVVPGAIKAAKVTKAALIDPITDAGRNRIVAKALRRAASDPEQAARNLSTRTAATPGFEPTAGQLADDAGIASLERAARAIQPAEFGAIDTSQQAALVNALRGVAGTPEQRAAAVAAREAATAPLYDTARRATVEGDDVISSLMNRPSMQTAKGRAQALAAERGEQLAMQAPVPAQAAPSGLLDATGNPLMQTTEAAPAMLQGRALHDLKMGLDDAIGSPGLGGLQGAERNAAIGTREEFLNWLGNKIPVRA